MSFKKRRLSTSFNEKMLVLDNKSRLSGVILFNYLYAGHVNTGLSGVILFNYLYAGHVNTRLSGVILFNYLYAEHVNAGRSSYLSIIFGRRTVRGIGRVVNFIKNGSLDC